MVKVLCSVIVGRNLVGETDCVKIISLTHFELCANRLVKLTPGTVLKKISDHVFFNKRKKKFFLCSKRTCYDFQDFFSKEEEKDIPSGFMTSPKCFMLA